MLFNIGGYIDFFLRIQNIGNITYKVKIEPMKQQFQVQILISQVLQSKLAEIKQ